MYWCGGYLLLVMLLKLGNAEIQRVPHQTLPFRFYNHSTPYPDGTTLMVEFPSIPALEGLSIHVSHIYNEYHVLEVRDPEGCLPKLFLQRRLYNASNIYPLEYDIDYYKMPPDSITFFNCSVPGFVSTPYYPCPILAFGSDDSVLSRDLVSCTMISRVSSPIAADDIQGKFDLQLRWTQPKTSKTHRIGLQAIAATGSAMLVLLFIVSFYLYRYFKNKGDDQIRLEKFLADYEALKPTRFYYADIKRITDNFKDKIGEGTHGTVFKGKLSSHIQVAVKVLNDSYNNNGQDFINEMSTMGKIHHINVVRLLGFCADGCRRALVYDFFPNGSLQKFISSPDNKENFLGWSKLQQIALAIAKGIEYLHQGCDYRILHFDINPCNVLLDDNFTPKISDFGLAKLCSKNQSTVLMTAAKGTLGYIAREVFSRNFGNVSYKSDIYSYGMLLLEMVGGRKNVNANQETFQVLYPEWIHNLIEGGDISIYIEDEVDISIARKVAIVGLWCIQWHPINRPSMTTVIQMLEGEADKLKVPPTPFDLTASTNASTIIPTRHLNIELDVIHELE